MLACSEVTRLWATEEIRRAPLTRRLAVRMHLVMCRYCRRYVRELAMIGAAARRAAGQLLGVATSAPDLERRLLEEVRRANRSRGAGV